MRAIPVQFSRSQIRSAAPGESWTARGKSIARLCAENRMLIFFVALALLLRLVFWFYTHRVWEDALITITAARNVWEGIGLTHHASEPRVHSFTSPISVLIPMMAEQFGAGLLALRLASLAATVATIYYAQRIALRLALGRAAQILVLGYLACDQLQIFFGMGGMETQVVTAIALALLFYFVDRAWKRLGWACGLATIARPEFILFLLPPIGIALLLFHRDAIWKVITRSLAIAAPWYLFATLYFGSPIPNTIIAKSWMFRNGVNWSAAGAFAIRSWRDFAPFKEFWCAVQAPFPDWLLQVVVAAVAILFLCGFVFAVLHKNALTIAGAAVVSFLVYRNVMIMTSYYMWYLPPFMALAFLVAGFGLQQLTTRWRAVGAIGPILAVAYAIHVPFSMPLEKKVETGIEIDVRERTGNIIAAMTKPDDTIVLEPLGYIGWAAFNKTVYDFPGLSSKVVVKAVKNMKDPSVAGLINALQPTHAVVRPNEFNELLTQYPETARQYELVTTVRAEPDLVLQQMGYRYVSFDREFRILRRLGDFDAVVRP